MNVTIHIGQCGNQLGAAFWSRLPNHPSNPFFDDGYARAILVDAEPKVVAASAAVQSSSSSSSDTKEWRARSIFRSDNIHYEQSGRGNNWALGYNGPYGLEGNEGTLSYKTMESLRREAERCDVFTGCTVMQSVSGGTGSGLGSHILELIRDSYPKHFLLTVAVTPFLHGETPLQHYNSLLTFGHMQQYTDAMIMFSNEDVLHMLMKKKAIVSTDGVSGASAAEAVDRGSVSLTQMNNYIADCMIDTWHPLSYLTSYYDRYPTTRGLATKSLSYDRIMALRPFEPHDFVTTLAPLPSTKFVELYTARSPAADRRTVAPTFGTLTEQLLRRIPRADINGGSSRTLHYQIIGRGDDGTCMASIAAADKRLQRILPCVNWNPYARDIRVTSIPPASSTPTIASARSMTIACNRSRFVPYLQHVIHKARLMYDANAYLHWYKRYGVDREAMASSFENVQSIVDAYRTMCAD